VAGGSGHQRLQRAHMALAGGLHAGAASLGLQSQPLQIPFFRPVSLQPRTDLRLHMPDHWCVMLVQLDDIAVTRVLSGTWRLHVLRLDRLWRLTNAVIVGLDDLFGLRDLSMSGCTGAVCSPLRGPAARVCCVGPCPRVRRRQTVLAQQVALVLRQGSLKNPAVATVLDRSCG